jgi:hypothetical protein
MDPVQVGSFVAAFFVSVVLSLGVAARRYGGGR